MDKKKLAQIVLTEDELKKTVYDLPEFFIEDCENLLNIDPRQYYVWVFWDEPNIGRPINLAELYIIRFLGVSVIHGNAMDLNEENQLQRKILGPKRGV